MADFVISSRLQVENAVISKKAISDIKRGIADAEVKLTNFKVSPTSSVMRQIRSQLSQSLSSTPIPLKNFKLSLSAESLRDFKSKLAERTFVLKKFSISDSTILNIVSQIQKGLNAHNFTLNISAKGQGGRGGGRGRGGNNVTHLLAENEGKFLFKDDFVSSLPKNEVGFANSIEKAKAIQKREIQQVKQTLSKLISEATARQKQADRLLDQEFGQSFVSVGSLEKSGARQGRAQRSGQATAVKEGLGGATIGRDIIRDWKAQSASIDQLASSFQRLSIPAKASKQLIIDNTDSLVNFGRQIGVTVRRFGAYLVASSVFYRVTDAISSASREFIEFDRNTIRLAQTLRVSRKDVEPLTKGVRELSANLGVSSQELLKVGVTLAQAGIPLEETQSLLEVIAKTQLSPSFGTLEDTVNGIIAIKNQFNAPAKDFDQLLSQVNTVAAATAASSDDFIEGVKRAGAAFSQSKGTFQEFLAIFGTLKSTTQLSAQTIGTALSSFTSRLQLPKTIEGFRKFGIELEKDTGQGKEFVGVFEAFRRISEGFRGRPNELIPALSQVTELRQLSKILPIFRQLEDGTLGFAQAERILSLALSSTNSLTNDAIQAQDSLQVQLTKVYEAATKTVSAFGNNESLRSTSAFVLNLTKGVIGLTEALADVAPALAIVGAVKLVGPVGRVGRGLSEGITGQFLGFNSLFRNPASLQPKTHALNVREQLGLSNSLSGLEGGFSSSIRTLRQTTLAHNALPQQSALLNTDTTLAINKLQQNRLAAFLRRLDEKEVQIRSTGLANQEVLDKLLNQRIAIYKKLVGLESTEASLTSKRSGLVSFLSSPSKVGAARAGRFFKNNAGGLGLAATALSPLLLGSEPNIKEGGSNTFQRIGAVAQNASFGAFAGSIGGAPGIAIGAAIGGIVGLRNFNKELSEARLAEKYKDLAINVGDLSDKIRSTVTQEQALQELKKAGFSSTASFVTKPFSKLEEEINSEVGRFSPKFSKKELLTAFGKPKSLLGILSSQFTDRKDAVALKLADRGNIETFRNQAQVLPAVGGGFGTSRGKAFLDDINKLKTELGDASPAIAKELDNIIELFKSETDRRKQSQTAVEKILEKFSSNLLAGVVALEKFNKVADQISATRLNFENQFSKNPTSLAGLLRNQSITSERGQQRKLISGLGLGKIGDQFNAVQDAKQIFFKSIIQDFKNFDLVGGKDEDILEKLSEAVGVAFSDPKIPRELTAALGSEIRSNENFAKGFREALSKNNLGDFIQKFFKDLEEPISRVAQETAQLFDSFFSELNSNLSERTDQIKRLRDLQSQSFDLLDEQGQFNRSNTRFAQTDVGARLGAIANRQIGLFGGGANDPLALKGELRTQLNNRNVADQFRRSTNPAEREAGIRAFAEATGKIDALTEALGSLANVSSRLAPITERLSEIEEKRNARFSLAEKVFTGDPKSNIELVKGIALSSLVSDKGGLEKLNFRGLNNLPNRQALIGALDAFGPNNLPGRNISGQQLKQRILGEDPKLEAERKILLDTANTIFGVAQEAVTALRETPLSILAELQKLDAINIQDAVVNITNQRNQGVGLELASGGRVSGPSGKDVIPAMLSKDEYVIKASSAKKHKRLLDHINNDSIQHFVNGGSVKDNQLLDIRSKLLYDDIIKIQNLLPLSSFTTGKTKTDKTNKIQGNSGLQISTANAAIAKNEARIAYQAQNNDKILANYETKMVLIRKARDGKVAEAVAHNEARIANRNPNKPSIFGVTNKTKSLTQEENFSAFQQRLSSQNQQSQLNLTNKARLNQGLGVVNSLDQIPRASNMFAGLSQEEKSNKIRLIRTNDARSRRGLEPIQDLSELNRNNNRLINAQKRGKGNVEQAMANIDNAGRNANPGNPGGFDVGKFAEIVNKLDGIATTLSQFPNKIDVEVKPVQVQITGLEFMNIMKDEVVKELAQKVFDAMTPESLKNKVQQATGS